MKLAAVVILVSSSLAVAAPSKAVATADAWLKAMLDGTAKLEKGKTIPYVTDTNVKPCAKLKKGTVKTDVEFKGLRACVFANRDQLPKKTPYTIVEHVPDKTDDGDSAKWLKTAPKGTVLVDATYTMGPQSAVTVMAVRDGSVVAVWVYFNEPEDTFGE